MAETQTTPEQLDRLYHLCGVLQRYQESWDRLEDAKRQDDARQHLFQARQAGLISGGDQDAGQHERDAIHSRDMIQRLDSAIENWTPLVNEFFRLAILNNINVMYQAFGQIETTMCMPHRIGSFDWKAFREELRAVRHDVMRRRAALIVNVAPSLVTLGDHPQIVLDGKDIALKYDAAVYLKALIDCGDWMSDPEFKAKLGSENDRPDRWRKQLPPEVRARIETDIRKGSRWRLA